MPFVTVHVNLFVPVGIDKTLVLALNKLPILDVPVVDHEPVPIDGTMAFKLELLLHTLKSAPAFEVDGVLLVTFT